MFLRCHRGTSVRVPFMAPFWITRTTLDLSRCTAFWVSMQRPHPFILPQSQPRKTRQSTEPFALPSSIRTRRRSSRYWRWRRTDESVPTTSSQARTFSMEHRAMRRPELISWVKSPPSFWKTNHAPTTPESLSRPWIVPAGR